VIHFIGFFTSRHSVPATEGPSKFSHYQLVGDLFAARAEDDGSPEMCVYDPASGERIAPLPINASWEMIAVEVD
jgi:hypothetical protein